MSPEVSKAFSDAKSEVSKLVLDFLKQAHALGIKMGDLAATTKYMFPPKQQFLFDKSIEKTEVPTVPIEVPKDQNKEIPQEPEEVVPTDVNTPNTISPEAISSKKSSAEKGMKSKKDQLPLIENPEEKHKEIVENMMDEQRWKDLIPFSPWTWFVWAPKPSGIYKKFPNATEALLKQWQDQAGNKFTNEVDGLTNLLLAIGKGWLGQIDYFKDKDIAEKISNLIGKEIKGKPWSTFVKKFGNENSAEIYLSEKGIGKPSRNFPSKSEEEEPEIPISVKPSIPDFEDEDGSYSY
jgi:hypothetical protein